MAYPASETDKFRTKLQGTVNALRDVTELLAIVEDQGATDAERAAFFQSVFGDGQQNDDITFAEFGAGLTALRNVRTAWDTNKVAIAKLLPK